MDARLRFVIDAGRGYLAPTVHFTINLVIACEVNDHGSKR